MRRFQCNSIDTQVDERHLALILASVGLRWDLSYRVPVPRVDTDLGIQSAPENKPHWKEWIHCAVCGFRGVLSEALGREGYLIYRAANFHARDNSRSRYRCDCSFKCTVCSYVMAFGIVVSREMWVGSSAIYDETKGGRFSDAKAIERLLSEGKVHVG